MKESITKKTGIFSKVITSLMVSVMAGLFWGLIIVVVAKNFFGKSLEYWSVFRWIGGILFVAILIGQLIKNNRKSKIILSLTDKIEKESGYPQEWFKLENGLKFVTVKEFIDDIDTLETFRHINSYEDGIEFGNDVYDYIDEKYFTGEERLKRKKARDLQKR